jgi:hypothetical protein
MSERSILDVIMFCERCGCSCLLRDAIPCADNSTRLGCPQPDCGGFVWEATPREAGK